MAEAPLTRNPSGRDGGSVQNNRRMDDDPQLVLPFAQRDQESGPPVTSQSRRNRRSDVAGRRVHLGLGRALEEAHLEQAVWALLPPGKALRLKLTDNRYTMVAVRRATQGYTVRIHRMFAGCNSKMLRAVARYVVHNDPRASALIGQFIDDNQAVIKPQDRRARSLKIRTAGQVHDLQAIFDRLNGERFAGQLQAQITWGPGGGRPRRRRSIKMGSFSVEDRIIRIHPSLDRTEVPGYFVAWIVFHEMLHGKHEVLRKDGRRCFHSKEFMAEERTFPDYAQASAWERANIDRLLSG